MVSAVEQISSRSPSDCSPRLITALGYSLEIRSQPKLSNRRIRGIRGILPAHVWEFVGAAGFETGDTADLEVCATDYAITGPSLCELLRVRWGRVGRRGVFRGGRRSGGV